MTDANSPVPSAPQCAAPPRHRIDAGCRQKIHNELDTWLDAIANRPLRADDGEGHEMKITASLADILEDSGDYVISFFVSRATEEII